MEGRLWTFKIAKQSYGYHFSELFLNFLNSIFNFRIGWYQNRSGEKLSNTCFWYRCTDTCRSDEVCYVNACLCHVNVQLSIYFPSKYPVSKFQSVSVSIGCLENKIVNHIQGFAKSSKLFIAKYTTFSILSSGAYNLPFSTHCYTFLIIVTFLLFTTRPLYILSSYKCYYCCHPLQNHVISISCLKLSYCYSFNHSERTGSLNGMFCL